ACGERRLAGYGLAPPQWTGPKVSQLIHRSDLDPWYSEWPGVPIIGGDDGEFSGSTAHGTRLARRAEPESAPTVLAARICQRGPRRFGDFLKDSRSIPVSAQFPRYVCIHGHFYQPPRENPWLEAIEVQDSAAPYHDWNERITRECYGPNGRARLVDPAGKIV